jgi:hypothetical protein
MPGHSIAIAQDRRLHEICTRFLSFCRFRRSSLQTAGASMAHGGHHRSSTLLAKTAAPAGP